MTDRANNVETLPSTEQIEEEAALWIARIDGGNFTAAERGEFDLWLARSQRHRDIFVGLSEVWDGCDILDAINFVEAVEEPQASTLVRRMAPAVAALAAVFAMVLIVIFNQATPAHSLIQSASFETRIGQQSDVELFDGSTVVLNTNSQIDVTYTGKAREVRLLQGEAHFDVTNDEGRPFSVYAGEGLVTAVGTSFSVRLRDESIEVVVSDGVVELFSRAAPMNSSRPSTEYVSIAALSEYQNAVFDETVEHMEKLSVSEINRKLLWREGMLGFTGEPLSDVVAEVSRYTDIRIEIDDPVLAQTPIGGFFVAGDTEVLFEALESVFDVEVEVRSPGHVVLSSKV